MGALAKESGEDVAAEMAIDRGGDGRLERRAAAKDDKAPGSLTSPPVVPLPPSVAAHISAQDSASSNGVGDRSINSQSRHVGDGDNGNGNGDPYREEVKGVDDGVKDNVHSTTSELRRRPLRSVSASHGDGSVAREGTLKEEEEPISSEAVRYFCKPNSTSLWDVYVVFFYQLYPFSIFSPIVNSILLYCAYQKYGSIALTIFFTVSILLLTLPGFYSPRLRRALRFLYVPLARYMRSMAYVTPPPSSSSSDDERRHIFAIHPHGRVFYTPTMLGQLRDEWHSGALGRKNDVFIAASSGFFFVPLLRNLLYALGVIPVSKSSVVKKLRQGNDVVIVVGGIKEVTLGTSDEEDVLFLARRKGFIKLAIEENAGVVPVYCFNENTLFKHDPKWFLNFWGKVNRIVVIGIPFFRGVWNLPMPYRRDILVAFGEPLFAKEGESTDAFHARYIQELKKLYQTHVALSGRPDHKLVII